MLKDPYCVFTAKINHPDNDQKVDNRGFCATINIQLGDL
jgi:hypothetical protein